MRDGWTGIETDTPLVGFPMGPVVKKKRNTRPPRHETREMGVPPLGGKIPWRKTRRPTPAFLPGESHRQRSLVGYSPGGHKESDTTE